MQQSQISQIWSLTRSHPDTIILTHQLLTLHFPPHQSRKEEYNNTRRMCSELRKMYKEVKVMQVPAG